MADKVTSPVAAATPAIPATQVAPTKKGAASPKSQKPRVKPAHPRTSEMVNAAISTLKERGGSSLQAIKKYITATYKLDAEKLAPFIKKYLKNAVSTGILVQTKGKGASGSFKMANTKAEVAKPKVKAAAPKPAPKKKIAAAAAATSPKKGAVAKKAAAAAKKSPTAVVTKEKRKVARSPAAKPPKAKSPSKAKKAPASKPKSPKPKKTTAAAAAPKTAKPAAAKKVASPKKK